MLKRKVNLCLGVCSAALASGLFCSIANSADISAVCEPIAATIQAGYMAGSDKYHVTDTGTDISLDSGGFGTPFGEGAMLYHLCDSNLNLQIDAAYYDHRFGANNGSPAATDDRWHVGGVAFWRERDLGVLGLDASYIVENVELDSISNHLLRIGARGEYFGGENFTLGGGVGYVTGSRYTVDDRRGFDANVWARAYLSDNLGLFARLDYGNQDWFVFDLKQWAATAEAEYLVPNHQISILAGLRHGVAEYNSGLHSDYTTNEAYAGFKVYFGSSVQGEKLVSHHRNNTLDNTSTLFEKLPEFLTEN